MIRLGASVAVLLLCGCGGEPPPAPYCSGHKFMPQSEFWQALPDAPEVDPNSAAYVADLRSGSGGGAFNLNTIAYGVPILCPPPGTARTTVKLAGDPKALAGVPVPDGARPAQGTDGHLVVIDPDAPTAYELWQASHAPAGWSAAAGVAFDTRGDGVNRAGTGIRASSLSLLLGVLTYDEVRGGGPIEHALAWAADRPNPGYYTSPATSSDGAGQGGGGNSVPEGARLQLDPALDVATLGLSPAGTRIARALQRYGFFLVDTSGDSSLIAESLDGTGRSWNGLLSFDEVKKVPVARLRVLKLRDKVPIK